MTTPPVAEMEREVEKLRYQLDHFDELEAQEESKKLEDQRRAEAEERRAEALVKERGALLDQIEAKRDPIGFLRRRVEPLETDYLKDVIEPDMRLELGKTELQRLEQEKRRLEVWEYIVQESEEYWVEVGGFLSRRKEKRTRLRFTRIKLGEVRYGVETKSYSDGIAGGTRSCRVAFVVLRDGRKVTLPGNPESSSSPHRTNLAYEIDKLVGIEERISVLREAIKDPDRKGDGLPYLPKRCEWPSKYRDALSKYRLDCAKQIARRFDLDNSIIHRVI